MRIVVAVVAIWCGAASTDAQWLTRRTPSIPRTADGKPNLTAPVRKTFDGRPDPPYFPARSSAREPERMLRIALFPSWQAYS